MGDNKKQGEKRRAEYEEAARQKRARFDAALVAAPPIELSDPEGWAKAAENNLDSHGARCVSYAEEWARLMQVEIATGKPLAEVVDKLSHDADYDGITGFMYGAAVSMLSQCWVHGEALRKWHNGRYGHEVRAY